MTARIVLKVDFEGARQEDVEVVADPDAMLVGALKGTVENITGIPALQQRLILVKGVKKDDDGGGGGPLAMATETLLSDVEKTLSAYGASSGDVIRVKNLGPQVAWRTVFLVEYAAPPVLYAAAWAALSTGSAGETYAAAMFCAHFVKRLAETLWVHRFGNDTMPVRNLYKNCAYYWGAAALIALSLNGGAAAGEAPSPVALGLWLAAQAANFYSHMQLRWLRSPGTRERRVPRGFAFELVSCPNYFFEVVAWVTFTASAGHFHWSAAAFTALGAVQMILWALQKHTRYRREFGASYPRSRKAIFPFIL